VDQANNIFLVDYQHSEVQKMEEGVDSDFNEKITSLYIPDFLYERPENNDIFFVGTDKSNVFVYSLAEGARLQIISSPVGDQVYEEVWG